MRFLAICLSVVIPHAALANACSEHFDIGGAMFEKAQDFAGEFDDDRDQLNGRLKTGFYQSKAAECAKLGELRQLARSAEELYDIAEGHFKRAERACSGNNKRGAQNNAKNSSYNASTMVEDREGVEEYMERHCF